MDIRRFPAAYIRGRHTSLQSAFSDSLPFWTLRFVASLLWLLCAVFCILKYCCFFAFSYILSSFVVCYQGASRIRQACRSTAGATWSIHRAVDPCQVHRALATMGDIVATSTWRLCRHSLQYSSTFWQSLRLTNYAAAATAIAWRHSIEGFMSPANYRGSTRWWLVRRGCWCEEDAGAIYHLERAFVGQHTASVDWSFASFTVYGDRQSMPDCFVFVFSSLRRSMLVCASVIVRFFVCVIFVSLRNTWLLAFLSLNAISIGRAIQLRLQVSLICLIIVQLRRHSVILSCYVARQRRNSLVLQSVVGRDALSLGRQASRAVMHCDGPSVVSCLGFFSSWSVTVFVTFMASRWCYLCGRCTVCKSWRAKATW